MGDCFAPGSSCAAILNRFGRREEARLRNLDSSSGELHRIPDAPNFEAEDIGTACWIQRRTIQERVRANEELLRSSNPFAHLEPRRANIEAPIKNWIFACLNHCSPPFHRTTTHPAPVPRRTGRTAPPNSVRFRFGSGSLHIQHFAQNIGFQVPTGHNLRGPFFPQQAGFKIVRHRQ